MKPRLKALIQSDIFRYFGRSTLTLREKYLLSFKEVALYCSIIYRKAHFYSETGKKFRAIFYRLRLNQISRKYQFEIPYRTTIGRGLCIVHFGRIIIAPTVVIGDNCNIFTGVTIGSTVRGEKAGVPTIKDNVWIGPNAVIVGNITIGSNVLVAANTYVNFDVPDHSIVLGNPGQILPNQQATDGYICRTV